MGFLDGTRNFLVTGAGLEPATHALGVRCSIH